MDKNTIECVAQLQGKINYDAGLPISKDDHYARLIKVSRLGILAQQNIKL